VTFSLLPFYTSLGLDLNGSVLDPNFTHGTGPANVVAVKVPNDSVVTATYHNYRTALKLSSAGKLSQRRKLSASVPINTYEVTTLLDGRQYRQITYPSSTSNIEVPQLGSYLSDRLYLKRLPSVQGVLTVDTSGVEDKLLLPWVERGFFPSPYLGSSMLESPPETVAWGLLAAVAAKEVSLVLSIIKEFIYQARSRAWFVGTDTLNVNTEPTWGFERFPVPLNPPVSEYVVKEVAPNALLGLALVLAIKALQETYPVGALPLYGARDKFQEELLVSVKALATFCSFSISPISGYAAYCSEAGFFTYETPTLAGSYLVDLFLSQYLSIDYDFDIHVRASRLHQVLVDSNKDVTSADYSGFVGRDYVGQPDPQDPTIVRSDPQAGIKYTQLNAAAYQVWWFLQFRPTAAASAFNRYETTRAAFNTHTGLTSSKPDYLVMWLYLTQPQAPSWVSNLAAESAELTNNATSYSLDCLAALYLRSVLYFVVLSTAFDYRSQAASTLVENAAQEIRRLWPYGSNWSGYSVDEDPQSVLGALLKAEAEVSYPWYLGYLIKQASLAPTTATGRALRDWVTLMLPQRSLVSDIFLRRLLVATLGSKDLATLLNAWGYTPTYTNPTPKPYSARLPGAVGDNYDSYTVPNQAFKPDTPAEDYFNLVYRPSRGFKLSAKLLCSDSRPINTKLGLEPRSVAGFPYRDLALIGAEVLCSDSRPVSTNLDLEPGPPVGYRYQHLPLGGIQIQSSDQIPLPANAALRDRPRVLAKDYDPRNPEVYVVDGPVFIDPLANYVATRYVSLDLPATSSLIQAISQTQTAGIKLHLTAPKEVDE
jgi:hypothetical protein